MCQCPCFCSVKALKSLSMCVWVTLFMFHLSPADVSWVKLNSWQWGGGITSHILLYIWGQDFSWPALIPWLSAQRGCCWLTTEVRGETGSSWLVGVQGAALAASKSDRDKVMQKKQRIIPVVIQISTTIRTAAITTELQASALSTCWAHSFIFLLFFSPPYYQAGLVNLPER